MCVAQPKLPAIPPPPPPAPLPPEDLTQQVLSKGTKKLPGQTTGLASLIIPYKGTSIS